MNAPHPLPSLTDIALKLANGEPAPVDQDGCYSDAEWAEAADYALATGDLDELSFMLARARDYERFRNWQRDGEYLGRREAERREFYDFGWWLDEHGSRRPA